MITGINVCPSTIPREQKRIALLDITISMSKRMVIVVEKGIKSWPSDRVNELIHNKLIRNKADHI